MLSTGVDIVEIDRVGRALTRWGNRFTSRVYTDAEIALCRGRVPELAVRFAGKEAVSKALGTGLFGVSWREMEILADWRGKPLVRLCGRAADRAASLGLTQFAISLSHSREFAVAFVVADSGPASAGEGSGPVAAGRSTGPVAAGRSTGPVIAGRSTGLEGPDGVPVAKIESKLQRQMEKQPHSTLRLIVRVTGDVGHAAAQLEKRGFTVGRQFSLVPGVAVSGSAGAALALVGEPWVVAVEADRQVYAQRGGTEKGV